MTLKVTAYAAGSLRKVLPAMFELAGIVGDIKCGPSGVLSERIVNGVQTNLFFSASMKHAFNLAEREICSAPIVFALNELCLFGKSHALKGHDALTAMLEPNVRLGTSTPIDDPGGDYAFAVFVKANALIPRATETLQR